MIASVRPPLLRTLIALGLFTASWGTEASEPEFQPSYDLALAPASGDTSPSLRVYGAQANDNLGRVVRTGDLNGDGVEDLIIGSPSAGAAAGRANAGQVWIWFGGEDLLGNLDAAGLAGRPPDVTVLGAEAADFLTAGGAVTVADINGDGIGDLLLGAYGGDGPGNSRSSAGEAYMIFGREDFPAFLDLAIQGAGGADVTIHGVTAGDSLTNGGAIAVADVNGDGLTDLLLGALHGDGPEDSRTNAGEAYVIYGRSQFTPVLDLAQQGAEGASVTLYGANAGELLTYDGTIRAGDINADGIPDLLIGAAPADGPGGQRPKAGRVYVVFGRPGLPPVLDLQIRGNRGANLTLYGASEDDLITSGAALLTADVNGDGIADLIIGTPGGDGPNESRKGENNEKGTGEAYIIFGRPFFGSEIDLALQGEGGADVTLYGATIGDNLTSGGALATGDINKDGLADLLIGAGLADGPGKSRPESGEAYVIFGRPTFPPVFDLSIQGEGGADVIIYGAESNDNLALGVGGGVALADLNRDGYSDLLIGSFNADGPANGRENAGEAYVIFGRSGLPASIDLSQPGSVDVTIYGASPGDQLTIERSLLAGDISGDGVPDLILGTANGDGPSESRSNAGEVSVIPGVGVPIIGPEIDVHQPLGTPLADGGGRYFGAVLLNNIGTRTFTVLNSGTETLTGLQTVISGANADDFLVDRTQLPAVLAPGASGTFTVTFQPTTLGSHLATLQILSDDEDENPYDIRLTGIGAAPELVIEYPVGTPLASESTLEYGAVATGYTRDRLLTLKNIGTADLNGLSATLIGKDATDYTLAALPDNTLPPGQSMTVALTFAPGDLDVRDAELHVFSDVSPDAPYLIRLTGTGVPPTPEITVRQPGATQLQNGDARNFGNVSLSGSASLSFRIDNTGTSTLTDLTLTTLGDQAGDFVPSTATLPDLAPGASANFTLTFTPSDRGVRTASLRITSNDADENPFVVPLSGSGVNPEIEIERFATAANQPINNNGIHEFPPTPMGSTSSVQFIVKNTGDDPLTGLALSRSGSHTSDFDIIDAGFTSSVPPGGSTSFSLLFTPLASGPRNATLRIASNDADENPFMITLNGISTAPIISVEAPAGNALAYNASAAFDPTLAESTSSARLFTVHNTGDAPLEGLNIAFTPTSPNRSEFLIHPPAATNLLPGASTTFSVAFAPNFAGGKNATLRITSNSPGANIMQVNLSGQGLPLWPLYGESLNSRLAITTTELRIDPLVTGADPKTYRWRKNGKDLKNTTPGLLFKSLKTSDAGVYQQTVANSFSSATSNNLWLAVATQPPASAAVKINGKLTLNSKVSLPPGASASYQWLHEGQPVAEGEDVSGTTSKTLKFTGIQPERAGIYTCRVTVATPDGSFQGTHGDTTVVVVTAPPELQPFSFADVRVSQDITGLQIPCRENPAKFAASGLPPGVKMDPLTGILSGRPTAARLVKGSVTPYQVKITVSNLAGKVVSPVLPWTIHPLPDGAVGAYSGVIGRSDTINDNLGGTLALTLTQTGACSGKLQLGKASLSFKGSLDVPAGDGNPTLSLNILRKAPLAPLTLTAELDLASGSLDGELAEAGGEAAAVSAWRRATLAGALTYTAALTPGDEVFEEPSPPPQGDGWATFKVSAKAAGKWTGRLADGSTFTHAAQIGEDGRTSLFALQQKNTGSLLGSVQLQTGSGDLDGIAIDWFIRAPATPRTSGTYRNGIPLHALTLTGGPYTPPAPGMLQLELRGGGLPGDLDLSLEISAALKLIVPTNVQSLTFTSFQAKTGLFSGSFIHEGRKAEISGLLVPRLAGGSGHFLLPEAPAPGVKSAPAWSGALRLTNP